MMDEWKVGRTYEWKVETVLEDLEAALNKCERDGWEVFSVFKKNTIVVGFFGETKIEYNIVMRKKMYD